MEKDTRTQNAVERFYDFMERDTHGTQVITYGIAGIGLIAAIYKIRPFSKFQKPSDVPVHFIRNRTVLQGRIKCIEVDKSPIILIDHKPLLQLPNWRKRKCFPIKIAGVDVNSNGLSWLQTIAVGKSVKFVPMSIQKDAVDCILLIPQKSQEPLVAGSELVKLGFGTVRPIQPEVLVNKENLVYQESLLSAQKWAKRKRNGQWQFAIPPTFTWKLRNQMSNRLSSSLPSYFTKLLNL